MSYYDISQQPLDSRRKIARRGMRKKNFKKKRSALPPEIEAKLAEATAHFIEGRDQDVITTVMEAIKMAGHLPMPYSMLGMIYEKKLCYKKAIACYTFAALLSKSDQALSTWSHVLDLSRPYGLVKQILYILARIVPFHGSALSFRTERFLLQFFSGDVKESLSGLKRLAYS